MFRTSSLLQKAEGRAGGIAGNRHIVEAMSTAKQDPPAILRTALVRKAHRSGIRIAEQQHVQANERVATVHKVYEQIWLPL